MPRITGTVDRGTVLAAIASLGLDPDQVASVAIDSHRVEAVVFDLTDDGKRYLIPAVAGHYADEPLQYAKGIVYLAVK